MIQPDGKREALWLSIRVKNHCEHLDRMIGELNEIRDDLKAIGADSDEELNSAAQSIAAVGMALYLIHPQLVALYADEVKLKKRETRY